MSFLSELGGIEVLKRVHRHFYDAIYAHPWFSQIFEAGSQERLESQQTHFMAQSFGGQVGYNGRPPATAHPHIMITEEMFDLRSTMLSEAIEAAGVSAAKRLQWLKVDNAFRSKLVKRSVLECKGRFRTDPIINIPNPDRSSRRAA